MKFRRSQKPGKHRKKTAPKNLYFSRGRTTGKKRRWKFSRRAEHFSRRFGKVIPVIKFMLAVIAMVLFVYAVFYKFEVLNVRNIEVTGSGSFVNNTDLKEVVISKVRGKNILTVKPGQLEALLMESFQGAKDIGVTKKLPDTVVVTVQERKPLALVYTDNDDNLYLVDEGGYILGIVDENTSNLPKIYYKESEIHVGYFLDKSFVPVYLEVLESMDKEKLKASSVSVSKRSVQLIAQDSVEVLLSRSKDISESVKALAQLLQQVSAEGENLRKVDLRYDKVIVEYRE